jgi:hypothetical protein
MVSVCGRYKQVITAFSDLSVDARAIRQPVREKRHTYQSIHTSNFIKVLKESFQ